MSCYCTECSGIRAACAIVDNIDLIKLCTSKEPEDFEVALNISQADKHLNDAHAILQKKHIGATSGKSSQSNGSHAIHQRGDDKAPASGARDKTLALRENRNSSTFNGGMALAHRGGEPSPPFSAQDSALVLRQKESPRKFGEEILSQRADENTPPASAHGSTFANDPSASRQESNPSPEHLRQVSTTSQVTNPWSGKGTSPPKPSKEFASAIRNRATELGILRGVNVGGNGALLHDPLPNSVTNIQDTKDPIKEKSRFIVCDHCRSHGLRCNEASVCKECIMRELPCTHRQCDQSPNDRELCPRQVCFYVHANWMPGVYGTHEPNDPNWIVLPGKLRDHLSAGALSKLKPQNEAEVVRCYHGVNHRQQNAMVDMTKCVQSGQSTWESISMACPCAEIEYEEARARAAEENIRRMQQITLASGL